MTRNISAESDKLADLVAENRHVKEQVGILQERLRSFQADLQNRESELLTAKRGNEEARYNSVRCYQQYYFDMWHYWVEYAFLIVNSH